MLIRDLARATESGLPATYRNRFSAKIPCGNVVVKTADKQHPRIGRVGYHALL